MKTRVAIAASMACMVMATSSAYAVCEPWPHCTFGPTNTRHKQDFQQFDMNSFQQILSLAAYIPGKGGLIAGIAGTMLGMATPQQQQVPPQHVAGGGGNSDKRTRALAREEMKRVFPQMMAEYLHKTGQILQPRWKAVPIPDDAPKAPKKTPDSDIGTNGDGKILPSLVSQSFDRAHVVRALHAPVSAPVTLRLGAFAKAIRKIQIKESDQPARFTIPQVTATFDTSNYARMVVAMKE